MGSPSITTSLHRAAKYFMDSGQAASHEAAMDLLERFGLTICVGDEIAHSAHHQTALLTLVNAARRTLLGGIEVSGLPDAPVSRRLAPDRCSTPCASWRHTVSSVRESLAFGAYRRRRRSRLRRSMLAIDVGRLAGRRRPARRGRASRTKPMRWRCRPHLRPLLVLPKPSPITPAIIRWPGAAPPGFRCGAPAPDWLTADPSEPALAYLPSHLWLIGLGNLGQAFAWLLAALPYEDPRRSSSSFRTSTGLRLRTTAPRCCRSLPMSGAGNRGPSAIGWRSEVSTSSSTSAALVPGRDAATTNPLSPLRSR